MVGEPLVGPEFMIYDYAIINY